MRVGTVLAGALISLTGAVANTPVIANNEIAYHRNYLYVGGQYVQNDAGEHIFTDQMYVEKLTPTQGVTQKHPIVFIHGQAQSGTNWLNKPDGGSGWASYFLSQGYECYLLDQTFRGRSPWNPNNGTMKTYSAELLQQRFTAAKKYMLWPQAALHTQWNGTGVMGDRVFDNYYASTVDFFGSGVGQQYTMREAGAALLDLIGQPAILLSHSQGGLMPWIFTDARPDLVHAIVSLEPTGPPFQEAVFTNKSSRPYGLTDIPLTFEPAVTDPETDLVRQVIPSNSTSRSPCVIQADHPTPRKLVNLQNVPTLVLTTESSYHAPYDWCTVKFLKQAGVSAEHMQLGELGIHGNGHMVFMEKNSDEVAEQIQKWIESQ
ncbi:Alpha/Beta hydrolase protein [Aspergillus avenaceus]|uniref:Alpha/Beta hydrolase protein n=1 Tax=Aspergillus avenaceus TaxID=36643 RepID=A0A5N6TML4_ASPAV|nr:Alpha/Beta hydrolase protein [Aspergillus avenaceus]